MTEFSEEQLQKRWEEIKAQSRRWEELRKTCKHPNVENVNDYDPTTDHIGEGFWYCPDCNSGFSEDPRR